MASFKSISRICILVSIFLLILNLGFCQAGTIESKYFTLTYYNGCNLTKLAQKLNVNHFLYMNLFLSRSEDIDSIISKALDAIYLEVSDILDIHVYSYHGKIKLCFNKEELKADVFIKGYRDKNRSLPAVYHHNENTIYISFSDLTVGMLAHEIAHAIISHYFVVPPPHKIQEVLTGYVEYSIRKATGTLSEINK